MSEISRTFLTEPINQDLESVPGINKSTVAKLAKLNISCTDDLLGHFFLCHREPDKFITWLTDTVAVSNQYAREISESFSKKLGRI